jgi:hypothetical protein
MEELKLFCAYCLSPLSAEDHFCAVCGGNRDDDPGVEMTEEEYLEQARKPCKYCGIPVITYASVCFSCKRELNND